jgi:AmmeMemoRadiSam system protein B/AmmeMemoRadiSam system protein A
MEAPFVPTLSKPQSSHGVEALAGGFRLKAPLQPLLCGLLSLAVILLLAACGTPSATPVPTLPASPSALEPTAPTTATPSPGDIHACQGAGTWFPGDPEELATMVDSYLAEAEKDAAKIEGEPIALIVPHAGYIYSGWVAAHAYRQVEGLDYDTVVIIGDTHTGGGAAPISVWARGAYETPLGAVSVDEEVAAALLSADSRILFDRAGHESEHPVENQLPFLQRTLDGDFKVVPIVLHDDSLEIAEVLSQALVKALTDRKALIVASTDLSHWLAYDDARASDAAMLAAVETMAPQALLDADREWMGKGIPDLATTMCSKGSVMTAMLAAPQLGANQVTVLQCANSGDVPVGERDRVVGYGAVMFWRGEPASLVMPTPLGPVTEAVPLTAEDKEELLAMARQTIAHFLGTGAFPHFTVTQPDLLQGRGAFVTLKKHGELRGCIGHLIGDRPLYLVVQNVAVSAAIGDQRFPPVTGEELSDLEIEVSVLSPLQQVESVDQIQVGLHGVIIRRGLQQAVYLPQVAPEQGWSREEMLENLSLKAGLSRDAWEKEGTRFYVFTAEVFGEGGTAGKGN